MPRRLVPPKPLATAEAQAKAGPQFPSRNPQTASAPLAAPAAVALPSPKDHLALLVIAFSLVTIAVVMALILFRRSRTPPSLISRSLDRPQ